MNKLPLLSDDRGAIASAIGLLATLAARDDVVVAVRSEDWQTPPRQNAAVLGIRTRAEADKDRPSHLHVTLVVEAEEPCAYRVNQLRELAQRMATGDSCDEAYATDRICAALVAGRLDLLDADCQHPVDAYGKVSPNDRVSVAAARQQLKQ